MPAIKNTKKTLVEWLSLKQESVKDKLLLERIGMNPTPSIELYDKLVEADPCWHKVDNLYFSSCPPELHFCHDLANWLSHYLYFFSFLFFSYLQLQDGAWESITWPCHNVTMVWRVVTDGHVTVTVTVGHMTSVTWRPWESKHIATVVKCISSREMSENSIEFSLSNSEQRDSWLNSSHRTLDTDTNTQ